MLSKEASDLKFLATSYGLPANILGRKIKTQGRTFEIVGCKPRAHKLPILGRDISTNKTFKFPVATVSASLQP